jgi:hypothetical protein
MEQIERARRYLERIRSSYAGVPRRDDGRDYYSDDVCSFFVHCHHIGDWVVALNRVGVTKADVDSFVDGHVELRICADFCNATKHCKLTRKLRSSREPHLARTQLDSSGEREAEPVITRCKFWILADGELYDALKLAEACMALWDEFVTRM